jgi:hypothetical protein
MNTDNGKRYLGADCAEDADDTKITQGVRGEFIGFEQVRRLL